jgi:ribose transport system ATP-binding protein
MDNPTQGIDIGSKYAIYKLILGLARQGKAVIVFTTEFPEIRQLADRCLVMYRGEINAVIEYKDLTEEMVMRCSTGGKMETQYEAAV